MIAGDVTTTESAPTESAPPTQVATNTPVEMRPDPLDVVTTQTTSPDATDSVDFELMGNVMKKTIICCFPLTNIVNICALVFAFEQNLQEIEDSDSILESEEYDVCGMDLNPDAFMTVSHYLVVAGAGGIALSIMQTAATLLYIRELVGDSRVSFKGSDNLTRQLQGIQKMGTRLLLSQLPVMLVQLAWAIVGIILYSKTEADCRATSPDKMMLAWAIITLCTACQSFNNLTKFVGRIKTL